LVFTFFQNEYQTQDLQVVNVLTPAGKRVTYITF